MYRETQPQIDPYGRMDRTMGDIIDKTDEFDQAIRDKKTSYDQNTFLDIKETYKSALEQAGLQINYALKSRANFQPRTMFSIAESKKFISYLRYLGNKDITIREEEFLNKLITDISDGINYFYKIKKSDTRLEEFLLAADDMQTIIKKIDKKTPEYGFNDQFKKSLRDEIKYLKSGHFVEILALKHTGLYMSGSRHPEVPEILTNEQKRLEYSEKLAKEYEAIEAVRNATEARELFSKSLQNFAGILEDDKETLRKASISENEEVKNDLTGAINFYLEKIKELSPKGKVKEERVTV